MSKIDTTYLERCIAALSQAYFLLQKTDLQSVEYDMYRSACVKEYEIILEQCGKLLSKILKPYFYSPKAVDKLHFKDIFRQAVLRSLLTPETCERWLQYRDNRNNTTHDYGVNFAQETLVLLPTFIADATELAQIINAQNPE